MARMKFRKIHCEDGIYRYAVGARRVRIITPWGQDNSYKLGDVAGFEEPDFGHDHCWEEEWNWGHRRVAIKPSDVKRYIEENLRA